MNNPLSPKQYPGLMAGKKIMYIHGFMSSAQSGTVDILRRMLPDATVVAEDIPLHPAEAMAMLRDMAQREQPDLIIGTSMGGMYARCSMVTTASSSIRPSRWARARRRAA